MGTFTYVGLATLTAKAMSAVEQAVTEAAEDLVDQAQTITPVDTGTLKASLHVVGVERGGTTVTAKVATGGEANEYALFVHEGTTRMSARPFLATALMENAPVYVAAMQRAAAGAF